MDLCAAINGRHLLSFLYDGHQRIAIPAAYGEHKTTGNVVLRAYQTGGTSSSRPVPLWDLFLVEKMTNCVILDEILRTIRRITHPTTSIWARSIVSSNSLSF
jgi:hypothetical protein